MTEKRTAPQYDRLADTAGLDRNRNNKHQQKTEETRGRLLRSARKIFARDGFEAARLEDIAKDAGHTRGAFYAHYKSKEDLFFALLEQQAYEHQAQIQRLFAPLVSQEEKLAALREYYVTKKATDRRWSMLMLEFKLFAARHPKLRPKLVETHRAIRHVFRQKIERLLPSTTWLGPEQEVLIRTVLETLLHGLVLEQAYDPSSLSQHGVEDVLRRVFDLLTREGCKSAESSGEATASCGVLPLLPEVLPPGIQSGRCLPAVSETSKLGKAG